MCKVSTVYTLEGIRGEAGGGEGCTVPLNSLGPLASNHLHLRNVINDSSVYTPTEVVT